MSCFRLNLSGPAFSVVRQAPGGGGLRGLDAKNQSKHKPTELKLCMSHYNHRNNADTKFEFDSSTSFGDMTSRNFHRKKRTHHQIRLFTSGKRV